MNNSRNSLKKKILKIMFFIPTILFLFICNIPVFTRKMDYIELRSGLIGEICIILIWFVICYILSSWIVLIIYRKNDNDNNDTINMTMKDNQISSIDSSFENKVYEYNFENVNIYKTMGEAIYFAKNKKQYLIKGKNNIKNTFNQLIIVGIFTGICLGLLNIKYLVIFSVCFLLLIYLIIKKNCENRTSRKNYNK